MALRGLTCRGLAGAATLLTGLALPAGIAGSQSGAEVDLALVLAVDCSYSVDETEYRLQMDGLAMAFRHPEVAAAIAAGPVGRIAVTVFQWSSERSQKITVPWTVIDGPVAASAFADRVETAPRATADGATSISAAVDFGARLLAGAPGQALRRVIDVSGDGGNNNGPSPQRARDAAVAGGITINGLTIINEVPYLDAYYKSFVTGGPGTFVIVANDYAAYREAILRKLVREILGPALS